MKTVDFLSYDNFMQLTDAEKDQYVSTKCAELKTGIKEKEYIIFRTNPTPPTPVATYLTFTAQQANSSVGFKVIGSVPSVSLQYSTDNGSTWNDYTFGNAISLPNIGDSVKFKGDNESFSPGGRDSINCFMEGLVAASGDITTLLDSEGSLSTLPENCFSQLFDGCTSLTQAPALPATTLANHCYESMFVNCTSLAFIEAMFTTEPGSNYTNQWVYGVAQNGTFVKSAQASWDVSGINGIPTGWTVETASA